MKNLDKWRKKERRKLALSGLVILPFIAALVLYYCFPTLFGDAWPTVVAVLGMLCWLAAFIIMGKVFRRLVIIRAMTENGVRLRTDRPFFPSKRLDSSLAGIGRDFSDNGYAVTDTGGALCAALDGNPEIRIFVQENAADAAALLTQMAQTYMRTSSRRKKRAYAVCFLVQEVTAQQLELSKDVLAIEGGCIMPVFYDCRLSRAYYMGGFTGCKSVEYSLQQALKSILLCYDGDFPEKTAEDTTQEEKEFNALDLDEIFAQMKSVPSQDKDVIVHMENGQVKLVGDERSGVIYYKTDNVGFAQMYTITSGGLQIDSLENLYICSPKVKKADFDMTLRFKKAVEDYLDEIGRTYYYR